MLSVWSFPGGCDLFLILGPFTGACITQVRCRGFPGLRRQNDLSLWTTPSGLGPGLVVPSDSISPRLLRDPPRGSPTPPESSRQLSELSAPMPARAPFYSRAGFLLGSVHRPPGQVQVLWCQDPLICPWLSLAPGIRMSLCRKKRVPRPVPGDLRFGPERVTEPWCALTF